MATLILSENKPLRLTMMSAFYFTQGVPNGLFLVAIPAWIVSNGGTAVQTAQVIASYMFFWIWKFLTALVMDRYTFLPMGRRRAWIIGAQSILILALLGSALIAPPPDDIALLSFVALACGFGASTQDVGIDGLAVDILKEDERSIAAGLMYGCGVVGWASSTFVAGRLIADHGIRVAFITGAFVVGAVLLLGIMLKEREGERVLPWTAGNAHPRNIAIRVEAWWPLLRNSVKAIFTPLSLLFVAATTINTMPSGVGESFHPVLTQKIAGWSLTQYTDTIATFTLIAGLFAMTLGGWIVSRVGEPKVLKILFAVYAALAIAIAMTPQLWTSDAVLTAILFFFAILSTMHTVASLPIAMRLCDPRVAATQYTVYMATSNFGRPLGAALAAAVTAAYAPTMLYYSLAGCLIVGLIIAIFARFPLTSLISVAAVEEQTAQLEARPVPDLPPAT